VEPLVPGCPAPGEQGVGTNTRRTPCHGTCALRAPTFEQSLACSPRCGKVRRRCWSSRPGTAPMPQLQLPAGKWCGRGQTRADGAVDAATRQKVDASEDAARAGRRAVYSVSSGPDVPLYATRVSVPAALSGRTPAEWTSDAPDEQELRFVPHPRPSPSVHSIADRRGGGNSGDSHASPRGPGRMGETWAGARCCSSSAPMVPARRRPAPRSCPSRPPGQGHD
jgi:hypothetical protein